jgi:hypothetical protein
MGWGNGHLNIGLPPLTASSYKAIGRVTGLGVRIAACARRCAREPPPSGLTGKSGSHSGDLCLIAIRGAVDVAALDARKRKVGGGVDKM